ncbi:transposase [Rhizobium leguminosarum]
MFSLVRGFKHVSIPELTLKSKVSWYAGLRCSLAIAVVENGATIRRRGLLRRVASLGVTACSVARRHGLTPKQLFRWRRLAVKASGDSVLGRSDVCASGRRAALEAGAKEGAAGTFAKKGFSGGGYQLAN